MDVESESPMETTKVCQHFLPVEVLTHLFGYVDPHTLVISCRCVCKLWKDTVESAATWKIQLSQITVKNKIVDSILPTAHNVYPWYMCYAFCKNTFGVNLFPSDMPEALPRYCATQIPSTNSSGNVYSVPLDSEQLGFTPIPLQLREEGIKFCFIASFGVSSISHTIDLYERGFTKKILESQPPIVISEWLTVRRNYTGVYHLKVMLHNSEWVPDYENGHFLLKRRTVRKTWNAVTHTFEKYRPDVRYITFQHGVNVCYPPMYSLLREDGTVYPGSKMAATKVIIYLPYEAD